MFKAGHSSLDYERQTGRTLTCDILYVVVAVIVTAVMVVQAALMLCGSANKRDVSVSYNLDNCNHLPFGYTHILSA